MKGINAALYTMFSSKKKKFFFFVRTDLDFTDHARKVLFAFMEIGSLVCFVLFCFLR